YMFLSPLDPLSSLSSSLDRSRAPPALHSFPTRRSSDLQADVTQADQVRTLFAAAKKHFGEAIHAVVNNALIQFEFNGDDRPKVEDLTWETMSRQFSGAVQAALNTTQAALDDMKHAGFGRIVNIGTNLVQNPVVPYHDYTAAKAALLAFTRTTAQDLGQYGINVNMLSGGLLQTTDASKATP